jgi:hypothetical protein
MTAIEHKELKGITVKNLVVTIMSTASIVASVMTTYFGLKNDISEVKSSQVTESRVNNVRIKILEDQVVFLQKEIDGIKPLNTENLPSSKRSQATKRAGLTLLSSIEK